MENGPSQPSNSHNGTDWRASTVEPSGLSNIEQRDALLNSRWNHRRSVLGIYR